MSIPIDGSGRRTGRITPVQTEVTVPGRRNPVATEHAAQRIESSDDAFRDRTDPVRVTQHEQASLAASELYKAMKGGVFGLGTDEKAIMTALSNKTPQQISDIRQVYRDHFGRDLEKDLQEELGGSDEARVTRLMAGDVAGADLVVLEEALPQERGMFSGRFGILPARTDEAKVIDLLSNRTPEQLSALRSAWEKKYGSFDDVLNEQLNGADRVLARALISGDREGAQAAALYRALGNDKPSDALETLESVTDPVGVAQSYERVFGTPLSGELEKRFEGPLRDRALALAKGDRPLADAARLRAALGDEDAAVNEMRAVLENRPPAEREVILTAYQRKYSETFVSDADHALDGDRAQMAKTLAETSTVSVAQLLHDAVEGVGTDEATILAALKDRSRPEIDAIRSEYRSRYGEDLVDRLRSELGGRAQFDVEQLLKGPPANPEEALQRLQEVHDFERGGLKNKVGGFVMDRINGKGERLDDAVARAEAFRDSAMRDGTLDPTEAQRLGELVGYSQDDALQYHESKEKTAHVASTGASLTVAIGATVATGGLGAPLAASVVAGATVGGTARVATRGAIIGGGYEGSDAVRDAGIGAVEGGTAALSSVVGRAAGHAVQASSGLTGLQGAALRGTANMATRSVIGGSAGSGARAATNEATWEDGVEEGLETLAKRVAEGGATGPMARLRGEGVDVPGLNPAAGVTPSLPEHEAGPSEDEPKKD